MIYELHITVDHDRPDFSLDEWSGFCSNSIGAKPLDIRLVDLGGSDGARQVMFAATFEGFADLMNQWRRDMRYEVEAFGWRILRDKLEVPLDKSAPFKAPAYHECHVKSLIDPSNVSIALAHADVQGWAASYNALFRDDDGLEKWYFTKRVAGDTDYRVAGSKFHSALRFADFAAFTHTLRMESETVIDDSNPALDEGWA